MKPSVKLLLSIFALSALTCGHSPAVEKKPLKVFILNGQSNMEGPWATMKRLLGAKGR